MLFKSLIDHLLGIGFRIRILVLSLIDCRRRLLLLGLGGRTLANHDEHLVLEPVEAVVVWLVVLPLSRGQLLVF
jgi:hypothetical protein